MFDLEELLKTLRNSPFDHPMVECAEELQLARDTIKMLLEERERMTLYYRQQTARIRALERQ